MEIDMSFSKTILFLFIFIVITLILIYINRQLNKSSVCPPIISPTTAYSCYDPSNPVDYVSVPINRLYIKTAHNCCCKGNFKNDYVDIKAGKDTDFCALKNCALNGVRALDFTVYAMNGVPVISASTTTDVNYKELYNHVDFNDTMQQVQRFFIYDSNTSQVNDPLFLIFRIQSDKQSAYDLMSSSLSNVFGVGNQFGNIIYNSKITPNTTMRDIQNTGVVIIIQPHNKEALQKSPLLYLTAYTLNPDGVTSPCINRFDDSLTNLNDDIHFLYPTLKNANSSNFSPSAIMDTKAKITFVAMNYQTNDANLKDYNRRFGKSSFLLQT